MRLVLTALVLVTAAPLAAQQQRANNANVQRAVSSINEADYRRRVEVLAHDSMRGRGTPSPELEEVATWIASEFRRFGLRPGGDSNSFMQRYPMRREQIDSQQTYVMIMGGPVGHTQWQAGRETFYGGTLDGAEPTQPVEGPLVVVAGTPADTARPFAGAPRGAIAMMVMAAANMRALNQYVAKAREAGIAGFIVVSNVPRANFNTGMARTMRADLELVVGGAQATAGLPIFVAMDSTVMPVLRAAGEDITAMRGGQVNGVRALQGVNATLQVRRNVLARESAPNVIGILEGSDPQLRNEYVFFTAHMDHEGVAGMQGCRARGADSICNGADDDASGTAGIIELAEAFATMNPRPRRSMVFMLVSGEERGLWGSRYYSEHPTLPLNNTVAAINLDMIGRNWRDTISVIGKEHSTLGETANRVTREHPEIGMQLVDDLWPNERFYFRSDHYNFARKGVPILFFFNGTHPDYHQVTDTADKIDAEKAARIVQMVYYIGLDVANTTERPQWNPQSRAQIVQ